MFRKILVPVAVILALSTAIPAGAVETSSRNVRYGDLNLANPKGVATLKARVADAVQQVCGDRFIADLKVQATAAKCRREAKASADTQLALLLETRGRMAARTGAIQIVGG
jgi:UrcA family protein